MARRHGLLRYATCMWIALVMGVSVACAPRTGAQQPGTANAPQASAQSAADFYRGKTITVVIGFPPGGGFDTTARILARHFGNHMPGNPDLIVENMDGAGSLIATNHLYNVAKPDVLTFGLFNEAQILNQLTGMEGVQFDARKFGWLGSVQKSATACTVRSDSSYNTAEDLTRRDVPPLMLGGTAVLALAVAQVVVALRGLRLMAQERPLSLADADVPDELARRRSAAIIATILGFAVSIWLLEFIITVPLMTFLYLKVAAAESWQISIGLAAVAGVFFYVVFVLALGVPTPHGPLLTPFFE